MSVCYICAYNNSIRLILQVKESKCELKDFFQKSLIQIDVQKSFMFSFLNFNLEVDPVVNFFLQFSQRSGAKKEKFKKGSCELIV